MARRVICFQVIVQLLSLFHVLDLLPPVLLVNGKQGFVEQVLDVKHWLDDAVVIN